MQSYCIFCIYTTFYTIKAYIITIKNKLMNKISYRYTTKIAITNHRRQRGYGRMPYPPKRKKVSKVVRL